MQYPHLIHLLQNYLYIFFIYVAKLGLQNGETDEYLHIACSTYILNSSLILIFIILSQTFPQLHLLSPPLEMSNFLFS